jgi:uncharacterized protein
MKLTVSLRQLELKEIRLKGTISVEDLGIDVVDEAIKLNQPLLYDLEVSRLQEGILVQGRMCLPLDCECVRCLKPFTQDLVVSGTICHLVLEGEEAIKTDGDAVDLTPHIRETILLEFPPHPVCEKECCGMTTTPGSQSNPSSAKGPADVGSRTWAELDKLKF